MAWRMLRRKDFHTGLVNLAFPKDHGVKKHFSSGTIGNVAQVYRGDRPKRAASCMPSNHFTIRNFHAGVYMLAWSRKREDVVVLKAPKREKRVKKENRTQPPVEAPYVAPKPKISIKSLLDKTVEIFDGMTLLDLSKRTGAYISTLQGILADLGEKVESEFDSISIDLAELAAMTLLFHGWSNNKPVPWLAATHHQLFNDTLLKLNKELAYLQFELRACMNQYDGMVYYGVVNNIADEESKLGTKYSVPQVAYYKGLLEAVVQEAGNDGTITSIDALNVCLDNQVIILDGGSQNSQSRLPSCITDFKLSQKEKTIDELVRDRWLSYISTGKIGLGIRSFLDLRSWFCGNDIPLCVVCNEACIKASSCPNEGCSIRIHEYCLKKKFSQRKASRACPGCGTEWPRQEGEVDGDDDANEPGEDGAASANHSSRKRRKGVKAELVQDCPSRKRRKGVKAELGEDCSSRKRRKGVKAELVEDNHNAGPLTAAVPRRARSLRRAKAEAVEAAQEASSAGASKAARASKGRKK